MLQQELSSVQLHIHKKQTKSTESQVQVIAVQKEISTHTAKMLLVPVASKS